MKKIYFLLILLITSCTKDPIEFFENVDWGFHGKQDKKEIPSDTISVSVQDTIKTASIDTLNIVTDTLIIDTPYLPNAENYSLINKTVGNIQNQLYTAKFFSKNEIQELLTHNYNANVYHPNLKSGVQYDFFNDGKIDYFGFSSYSRQTRDGIYFLIRDIYDDPKPVQIFQSSLYASDRAILSDTDGDGINEILFFSTNSHGVCNNGGGNTYLEQIIRVKVNYNGTISEERIGSIPIGTHDATSGDIDNDGDIDLVVWPIRVDEECISTPNIKLPIKLINDGVGNFYEEPFFSDESFMIDQGIEGWYFTSYHLFDIDGDGILDLIGGHFMGDVYPTFFNEEYIEKNKDLQVKGLSIIYGHGGGNFYYDDIYYVDESINSIKQSLYGISFTDYDKDGKFDIITTSYQHNTDGIWTDTDEHNYIVDVFKNNGKYNIVNETQSVMDGYEDLSARVFSNFYTPIIQDIDNDGDYEIIATQYHYHGDINYLDMLYWENVGGYFVRREVYGEINY